MKRLEYRCRALPAGAGVAIPDGRRVATAKVKALEPVGARVVATRREIPELMRVALAARGITGLDLGDALVGPDPFEEAS